VEEELCLVEGIGCGGEVGWSVEGGFLGVVLLTTESRKVLVPNRGLYSSRLLNCLPTGNFHQK
jgi:hypothetical protein